jgi:hypothetical protein
MVPDALQCPHCGAKDFNLVGYFKRAFEQPYVAGQVVKEGLSLGQNSMQTIEGLSCSACQTHTIIEDDNVFEREMLIFDLQTQIATLQGKVPPTPTGKEWKN